MKIKLLTALLISLISACDSQLPDAGKIQGKVIPQQVVELRFARQQAANPDQSKHILFGDLHVHSGFSSDAYLASLPHNQGDGLSTVADACDFSRYCADLDFWGINDHAQSLNHEYWQQTKTSIEQCNAIAANANPPDLVSFLGFEWSQVGSNSTNHFGNRNVIFKDYQGDNIPARPIAANVDTVFNDVFNRLHYKLQVVKWPFIAEDSTPYWSYLKYLDKLLATSPCDNDTASPELPLDCQEQAAQPADLLRKLDQWGAPSLVIPNGHSWGMYTPADSHWQQQLTGQQHDPSKQKLIEIYSGHGNTEHYRPYQSIAFNQQGESYCPEPSKGFLPCCWRAGEIIAERCDDPQSSSCQQKIQAAKKNYLDNGPGGHLSISGEDSSDWKNCGQCEDCFAPTFNHRPLSSVQAALASSNFDELDDKQQPRRFRFGFISSGDNHTARPGTGYKEYERGRMTHTISPHNEQWRKRTDDYHGVINQDSLTPAEVADSNPALNFFNWERMASFSQTGGLIAVHSQDRGRESIWQALQNREVYGTSGPKILLWFTLLNGPNGPKAMGSEVSIHDTPQFQVRAAGSFKQKPGCPEHVFDGITRSRVHSLCRNECYNPSEQRHPIERIEIVRIKPQNTANENLADLIEDPWRSFDCDAKGATDNATSSCTITFDDPDFIPAKREFIYYARALQQATPTINAGGLRCEYDDNNQCIKVNPCHADDRTAQDDNCLAPQAQRAWSSPIFVTPIQ